ncbi:MAG: pitrilysin family protein [Patescibacteria group bacterium]|nr:pitrilysin family protein [Patescibacteria group bacterium]
MKISEFKLKNGLPVFLIKLPQFKTATVLVMYKTGSKYEDRKTSGLSHFLEHMFFKGTIKRPNTLSLSAELDSIGAEFNAFTGKEYTGYYVKTPKNKIGIAVDVLGDMLTNSKFDSDEIEREKGVIIEEMNMYEDNPMMHIEDVFESCLYGDTPAGWDTIGSKENVMSFKREDFINYFKTQYGVKSAGLFLAGDFSVKEIKKILEEKFAGILKNNYKNKSKVVEKQSKANYKIKTKKTDQMTLSLGFRTVPANHKDEVVLKLLSIILGGSMSSRLFIELRERRGLAYYVRANTEFYSDCGYLTVQAGVPKDKFEEAVTVILSEYQKLKNELVSAKELKRAKDLLTGKLIVSMEGSDDFSTWYGRQFPTRDKFSSPEETLKKFKKVSDQDIRRVAKNLFVNKSLNLAVIGDVKDDKKISSILKIK